MSNKTLETWLAGGRRKAFSLVEVVLALAVGVFALLLLVAVIPTGIQVNRDSRDEYQSMEFLRQIQADLRSGAISGDGTAFKLPTIWDRNAVPPATSIQNPTGERYFSRDFEETMLEDSRYKLEWTVHNPSPGLSKYWIHLRLSWPSWPLKPVGSKMDSVESGSFFGGNP